MKLLNYITILTIIVLLITAATPGNTAAVEVTVKNDSIPAAGIEIGEVVATITMVIILSSTGPLIADNCPFEI